jgi:hypothetical protein
LRKGIRQAFVETLAEARAKLALEALQDLDHIERAKLVGMMSTMSVNQCSLMSFLQ